MIEWTQHPETKARVGTVNGQARFLIQTTPARHFKLYQDGEYLGQGKLKALQAACENMASSGNWYDLPEYHPIPMAAAESRTKAPKPRTSSEIDLEGQQAAQQPVQAVRKRKAAKDTPSQSERVLEAPESIQSTDTPVQQSEITGKVSSRKAAKASHAKRLDMIDRVDSLPMGKRDDPRAEVKRFIESHGPQYFDTLRADPLRLNSTGMTAEDINPKVIRELVQELEEEKSAIYAAWVANNADPNRKLTVEMPGHSGLDSTSNNARKTVQSDYNDPTPVTHSQQESETMATATKTPATLKINETAARKLLGAVGIASDDAPLKKLQARVESLPDMAKEADFKEPESAAEKKLLKSIIDGLSSGKTIELATANGNGHPIDKAIKSTAKASKNGKAEKAEKVKMEKVAKVKKEDTGKRSKVFDKYAAGPFTRWLGRKKVDVETAIKILNKFQDGGCSLSEPSVKWELKEERDHKAPAKVAKEDAEAVRKAFPGCGV